MDSPKNKLLLSQDGSHTITSGQFGVTYHSKYGSINESQVVFIDAGLQFLFDKDYHEISVFEMGFGTGLNALMSLQFSLEHQVPISYHTIEAYPLEMELIQKLNYVDLLNKNKTKSNQILDEDLFKMHLSISDERVSIRDGFRFKKTIKLIENHRLEHEAFDCCFFDAFAPSSQAELWSQEILESIFRSLRQDGILVSYCAKGVFKRTLKSAGFFVESIPGPPGKREMTRAHKK